MIKLLTAVKSSRLLLLTLGFLVLTDVFIIFNIPVLRQLSGFIFLTFVPGALIVAILKLNKLGMVEKIVLSVGSSIAFVMLFGLIVNYVSLALEFTKPLSTLPMLASFGTATVLLAVFAYNRNKGSTFSFPRPGLTVREKLLLIIPSLFPIISIAGMRVMSTTGNNTILLFFLFLIPAYITFIAIYQKNVPERLYPAFIYLISISLLLLLPLRGNHMVGSDIHESYFFFQATSANQNWSVITPSLIDSLLSISLIPAVYDIFMKMNPEVLFQLLFPILFSITPIAVYFISKKYVGSFYAFIASFMFMSQFYFIWATTVSQTNLAIEFFTLAIMVWFHDGLNEFSRRLFFLIFAVSSVVSHYSTSFIFFAILLFTWLGVQLMQWVHLRWKERRPTKIVPTESEPIDPLRSDRINSISTQEDNGLPDNSSPYVRREISLTIILLFFVVIFLWHAQIANAAFDSAVNLVFRTLSSMNQSLLLESKSSSVTAAIGQSNITSVPQQIRFVVSWLTVLFVALGGVIIALRYGRAVAYPDSKATKPAIIESKFELEYFVLSAGCGLLMTSAVILPYISQDYSMERTYFQMLAVLSVYFVICAVTITGWLRIKPYLIMLPILVIFFLSITGVTYEFFNIPASILLNSSGSEYEHLYVSDEEHYAAVWLAQFYRGRTVYSDYGLGSRILASQGDIPIRVRESLNDVNRKGTVIPDSYIYLFYPDVVEGKSPLTSYAHMDIVPMPELLANRNQVYTDGPVKIYR